MIRFLFWLLVFAMGLAAAVVWKGEMHHLRRAVPEGLPDWTAPIADEAGVLQGRAVLPVAEGLPAMELLWSAKRSAPAMPCLPRYAPSLTWKARRARLPIISPPVKRRAKKPTRLFTRPPIMAGLISFPNIPFRPAPAT